MNPKFWEVNPTADPKTLEHVSDQYAVVELNPIDKWSAPVWGCIDKNFSVGYIFHVKCEKDQAINFCLEM